MRFLTIKLNFHTRKPFEVLLFMNLSSKRLNQIDNKMLATNSRHGEKVSLREKQVK